MLKINDTINNSEVIKYLENYKIIDPKLINSELMYLYHPYSFFGGELINVIIEDFKK